MVKLYYVAVFHRHESNNTVLWEDSDLSDFGFFRRRSAMEFMRFSCQLLIGRTEPGSRISVREQGYVCHIFVLRDQLAAAAVTDEEYPPAAMHLALQDLLDDYVRWENSSTSTQVTSQYPGLADFLKTYQLPRVDKLTAIRQQLDETKIVLHQTMNAVLTRGENLDELVAKTDALSAQSKVFYTQARKTNACCHAF